MSEPDTQPDLPAHAIVVPNSIDMVALLGPGDEHLALIERAFDADVHVRGNEITLPASPPRSRSSSGCSTSCVDDRRAPARR